MMTTATPLAIPTASRPSISSIPPLSHDEAMVLATTEFARMGRLLGRLLPEDWSQPTVCTLWNVQEMAAHVVGMAEAQASFRQFLHDFRSAGKRTGGAMIDAMNATQVRERADVAPQQLVERLNGIAAAAVRSRRRAPALMRKVARFKQDPPFGTERWSYGFLVDTIFTRDTWMHRIDISRATERDLEATPEHDGRIVALVAAEWARRHGRPFTLTLTGTAGGSWMSGDGGEQIELDAIQFCCVVAGRAPGEGLLATPVPF
jgi:uncharacterized protein (TIGR03083 family)